MQVREQRVGADMGKQEISDGHQRYEHRYGAQDQTASCFEEAVKADAWTPLIADPPALATRSILERLNEMDHRPWPEWTRGNPLTAHGLARLLTPFGVVPGTIRTVGIGTAAGTAKGYKRSAFAREWKRYSIGDTPDPSVTRSQSALDRGFGDSSSVTNSKSVTDPQSRKPSNRNDCDGVTASPSLFPHDRGRWFEPSRAHQIFQRLSGLSASQESLGFFAFAMKPTKKPGCHASAVGFRRVREGVRVAT